MGTRVHVIIVRPLHFQPFLVFCVIYFSPLRLFFNLTFGTDSALYLSRPYCLRFFYFLFPIYLPSGEANFEKSPLYGVPSFFRWCLIPRRRAQISSLSFTNPFHWMISPSADRLTSFFPPSPPKGLPLPTPCGIPLFIFPLSPLLYPRRVSPRPPSRHADRNFKFHDSFSPFCGCFPLSCLSKNRSPYHRLFKHSYLLLIPPTFPSKLPQTISICTFVVIKRINTRSGLLTLT